MASRRRPRHVRSPKKFAYAVESGQRTHASNALKGPGLYTIAWRDASRKKLPRKPDIPENRYFSFTRGGKWRCDNDLLEREGMSPTHRMLQEIIREHGFVQCNINGKNFWMQYETANIEVRVPPAYEIGKGATQTDVLGLVGKSCERLLIGRNVATEVGVTSFVVAYRRYIDLVKTDTPCLELIIKRDLALEEDPRKLLKHLTAALLNGTLEGRWIVAPWRKQPEIITIAEARLRAQLNFNEAAARRDAALAEAKSLAAEIDKLPRNEDFPEADRRILESISHHANAVLVQAAHRNAQELHDVDFVQRITDMIFPSIKRAREQRLRDDLERTEREVRDDERMRRSGYLTHLEAIRRSVRVRNDEREERRRDLHAKRALHQAIANEHDKIAVLCQDTAQRLKSLGESGLTHIFLPSGMPFESAVGFEYRRWCAL
jgi:hypothetical protein